jgi:hypothetical protein
MRRVSVNPAHVARDINGENFERGSYKMIIKMKKQIAVILSIAMMSMTFPACTPQDNEEQPSPSVSEETAIPSPSAQASVSPAASAEPSGTDKIDRIEDLPMTFQYTDESGEATRWKITEILVDELMQSLAQPDDSRTFWITDYIITKYLLIYDDHMPEKFINMNVTLENLWYFEYAATAFYEGVYSPDEILDWQHGADGYTKFLVEDFTWDVKETHTF